MEWKRRFLDGFAAQARHRQSDFRSARPFPHIALDGLFDEEPLQALLSEFPPPDDDIWDRQAVEGIQVKLRTNWTSELEIPRATLDLVHVLNSGHFMKSLSEMTGIPALISDPYYTGGGLNCILPGGMLDVHADGNWHHAMGVHRRINVILYLNERWDPGWGGQLELWDEAVTEAQVKVDPLYNRLVVFETHDKTYHGHPGPLACPSDRSRKSLILYYYTASPRPSEQVTHGDAHRALWRKLGMQPLTSK